MAIPKTKVLVLYDYFDPAFKAGGPIRSIANMVKLLEEHFDFFVLTTNQDHDGSVLPVEANRWLHYGKRAQVYYVSPERKTYSHFKKIIVDLKPDTVYINGVFSLYFTVYPLWILRHFRMCRIIVAPRGMLQRGALAIKATKKRLYLKVLKRLVAMNKIVWHVTNPQEEQDLHLVLRKPASILLGNIPSYNVKNPGDMESFHQPKRFGTVALVSPMKNIHLIIMALGKLMQPVEYALYGPVKDQAYWQVCQSRIANLPEHISFRYRGEIQPAEVAKAISGMDFYIQPSVSENFGHSIFEAFNAGVPVIISNKTPWKNLKEKEAGWDIDLNDAKALKSAIDEALNIEPSTYLNLKRGARKIAENYMNEHDLVNLYTSLLIGETI